MQKGRILKWLLLVLAGLLLFIGFKISGIGENLAWTLPSAQATDKSVNGSGGACTRNIQGPSFRGSIVIGSNEIVCGDVTSFGGSVVVQGELRGNVTAFNSNTLIAGEVIGNLTLFGGIIALNSNSQVHGHIDLYGTRELNAQGKHLEGAITDQVLVVLVALILPIPLALILALGLIAAWILGTVAVSWTIGDHILRAVAPQYNTRLIDVVVGLTVLVLVGSIPYIGWLINIGVGLLGLGAVFLSRFGTRL